MGIYNKVRSVEKVFHEIEKEMQSFSKRSKVTCLKGCFRCCSTDDINASVLEFLPLAYRTYKLGKLDELYEKLQSNTSRKCINLAPFTHPNGEIYACSNYTSRGLVCRLFGYSSNTDKQGDPNWVTCRELRDKYPEIAFKIKFQQFRSPSYTKYYMKLVSIDPNLANEFLPINEAILKATEMVLFYASFK